MGARTILRGILNGGDVLAGRGWPELGGSGRALASSVRASHRPGTECGAVWARANLGNRRTARRCRTRRPGRREMAYEYTLRAASALDRRGCNWANTNAFIAVDKPITAQSA